MLHAPWSAARYATSQTPRTGTPARVVARAAPAGAAYRGVVARAPNAAPAGAAPVYRAVVARGLDPAPVAGALAAPADAVVPVADKYWRINGNVVGNHVDATVFAVQLFGPKNVDRAMLAKLKGMTIRQHMNGLFVVSDVVNAFLIKDPANVHRWVNKTENVHVLKSPSLTYVANGHAKVTLLKFDL